MTDVITDEDAKTPDVGVVVELDELDQQLVGQLVDRARSQGLRLTGEDGLLAQLTKTIIESAAEGEMDDHLGYGKHDPAGRDGGNSRNGARTKSVLTDIGPVEVAIPRDRDGTFEPQIVRKRQRRLSGLDSLVISLSAKGLTHGEICAHLAEVYGASVSKQTISTITDRVIEGMSEWQTRPLDAVYPVVFIDAINVKIRDGNVANRPIYIALAVTVDGTRDVLGLWAGEHGDGEGSKYWLRVLSEIKNRGTQDVCIVVCDGLKGLPDAIANVWPAAITQTCVIHLLRNSFRYASKKDWAAIAKDLKLVYTAASESAALDAFVAFTETWGQRYPAIIKLWENAWAEFVPFLAFDKEIRSVICTTNSIESLNSRIRRAVNARGHFLLVTWNQSGAERISARGDHGTGRRGWRQRGWRTSGRCSAGTSTRRAGCRCGPIWVGRSGRSTRMRADWPSSCRSVRTTASTRSPRTGPMSLFSSVS